MKFAFHLLAVPVLVAFSSNVCFALWDVDVVTTERAKELGIEVKSTRWPTQVMVELEFKDDGELKDFNQIDLRLADGDNFILSAPLREDRSKQGRVSVRCTVHANQLDNLTLEVRVPFRDGGAGGIVYEVPVKDFVR